MKAAREPGCTPAHWAPLAEFVATGEFERVGTWLEVMSWWQYTEFLTLWAAASIGFAARPARRPRLVRPRLQRTGGCASRVTRRSTSACPVPEFLDLDAVDPALHRQQGEGERLGDEAGVTALTALGASITIVSGEIKAGT